MIGLWVGIAMGTTPELADAVRAVEAFEALRFPTVRDPNDRREAEPFLSGLRALIDGRAAAEAALAPWLDGSPALAAEAGVLSARVTTHVAALADAADAARHTAADDDLPAALWRDAEAAWLGVVEAAARAGWWGAAAVEARAWLVARDPALVDGVSLPMAAWTRHPCDGDVDAARAAHHPRRWRTVEHLGCAALASDPQTAADAFGAVVERRPRRGSAWIGLAQARAALGEDPSAALERAVAADPRDPVVRWTVALHAWEHGRAPDLEGRWPRSWRSDVAALREAVANVSTSR